ncbi:hypothetical protein Bca52824_068944 [Brassica carinata]|uniref:Uncharacterized protein n=1 Tax=Brassica carinata TaxID=52824 RepID=A0A8X7Q3K3_BRACI|nr:hypothetical protein Bca52824_068944 [Brassica carinata]
MTVSRRNINSIFSKRCSFVVDASDHQSKSERVKNLKHQLPSHFASVSKTTISDDLRNCWREGVVTFEKTSLFSYIKTTFINSDTRLTTFIVVVVNTTLNMNNHELATFTGVFIHLFSCSTSCERICRYSKNHMYCHVQMISNEAYGLHECEEEFRGSIEPHDIFTRGKEYADRKILESVISYAHDFPGQPILLVIADRDFRISITTPSCQRFEVVFGMFQQWPSYPMPIGFGNRCKEDMLSIRIELTDIVKFV